MKLKIKTKYLVFSYCDISPGVKTLSAFCNRMHGPIGTVWFSHVARSGIQILDSYVTVLARRQGVRTALHTEMLRGYPDTSMVVTGRHANKKSKRWMKKQGYKYGKMGWVLKTKKSK